MKKFNPGSKLISRIYFIDHINTVLWIQRYYLLIGLDKNSNFSAAMEPYSLSIKNHISWPILYVYLTLISYNPRIEMMSTVVPGVSE